LSSRTTPRADARALAVGLAFGTAAGLTLGGVYAIGGAGAPAKQAALASAQPAPAPLAAIALAGPVSAPAPAVASQAAKPTPAKAETRPVRELDCLAQAVYYEARGETAEGQAAIAQVVLNRTHHAGFPKTVCGVVYQGAASDACQFSFACDGTMRRPKEIAAWARARSVAARALNGGAVAPEVGQATHFHAANVNPGWGPSLLRVAQVGLHVFYRLGHAAPEASEPSMPYTRVVVASMAPGLGAPPPIPASVRAALAGPVAKIVPAAPVSQAATVPAPAPTSVLKDIPKPKTDPAPTPVASAERTAAS
jgi:spore germination cell wall hydrolase CwlJ-like protein